MWVSENWKDYALLDCSDGEKLERWGGYILRRPEPQAIWSTGREGAWEKADAVYQRSSSGGGRWTLSNVPPQWQVSYGELTFRIKLMNFKHTGLFPEQAANWDWMSGLIREETGRTVRVLNLFGYTGGATLACAAAGAHVTHVDAAKGMVLWAKENRELSRIPEERCRWIVEDALRFVQREIRRGNTYDGILMDPPSYGRGPSGEVWKLENELYNLVETCSQVLSEQPLFFLINSYTTGFQASVLNNMLEKCVIRRFGGRADSEELCLPVTTGGVLPCGASGRWQRA